MLRRGNCRSTCDRVAGPTFAAHPAALARVVKRIFSAIFTHP
ncbi:hypothetical protein J2Z49_001596 [Desulfofundulus luciae]|uniref:Uncharacterized protein n=1 Tax=Desulfofundulus luciae TaxID=74702 RepID=A0ABU0B180_9FIRM|nr:hypothetical protein [Desulfofundulus luciae]